LRPVVLESLDDLRRDCGAEDVPGVHVVPEVDAGQMREIPASAPFVRIAAASAGKA
jgi:hypothetical protein